MPRASSTPCSSAASTGSASLSDVEVGSQLSRKACDQCHRRKTRCSGITSEGCNKCQASGLECTYGRPLQRRGPIGRRGRVLNELRQNRGPISSCTALDNIIRNDSPLDLLYPTPRTLESLDLYQLLGLSKDVSNETFILFLALGAYTLLVSESPVDRRQEQRLHRWALELMGDVALRWHELRASQQKTVCSVTAAISAMIVLSHCHLTINKQGPAGHHIKDAAAFALGLGMHEESYYETLEVTDAERHRALYWLLFVGDREQAILWHCAPTLPASLSVEADRRSLHSSIAWEELRRLSRLYYPFDGDLLTAWHNPEMTISPQYLLELQATLDEHGDPPTQESSRDTWAWGALCSQLWLKVILWQVAVRRGFTVLDRTFNVLSVQYPLQLAQTLVQAADCFPDVVIASHSVALVSTLNILAVPAATLATLADRCGRASFTPEQTEKVFDIGCAVIDVMQCVTVAQIAPEYRVWECLDSTLKLINSMRSGWSLYTPVLNDKLVDAGFPVIPIHSPMGLPDPQGLQTTVPPSDDRSMCII